MNQTFPPPNSTRQRISRAEGIAVATKTEDPWKSSTFSLPPFALRTSYRGQGGEERGEGVKV